MLIDDVSDLDAAWLDSLAQEAAGLRQFGQQVLIVSSGAVAVGAEQLQIHCSGCGSDETLYSGSGHTMLRALSVDFFENL